VDVDGPRVEVNGRRTDSDGGVVDEHIDQRRRSHRSPSSVSERLSIE